MTASGHLEFVERLSLDDIAQQLAVDVAAALAAAVDSKGGASIAVPGGSTPLPFFLALSAHPIDWSKVRVTLTDERWVSADAEQSNARLVREGLRGPAAKAVFAPPQTLHTSLNDAASAWDADLRAAPPFDLVVLGMGDDGHFASLFPGGADLARNLDPQSEAFAVAVPDRDPPRLSLTLSAILKAERVCLLIAGE
ncbi:MAG: 6-phosphogluconolactonase, partial [Caulobacterales bacterium]